MNKTTFPVFNCFFFVFFFTLSTVAQEVVFSIDSSLSVLNISTHQRQNFVSENRGSLEHVFLSKDRLEWYPVKISPNLNVTNGYDFFQGLQSPFDPNVWIYLERAQIGAGFKLQKVNAQTGKIQLLQYEHNTNRNMPAYKPIA